MKIGFQDYLYYGSWLGVVFVSNTFFIIDQELGVVGCAKTKADAKAFIKKTYDYPDGDIDELLELTLHNCEDVKPYKAEEKEMM